MARSLGGVTGKPVYERFEEREAAIKAGAQVIPDLPRPPWYKPRPPNLPRVQQYSMLEE